MIKVKSGTPDHGRNLCLTCKWAIIVQGHAHSDIRVQCREIDFGKHDFVPFPVAECSEYELRGALSLHEMKQMAYLIEPRKDGVGFTHRRLTKEETYE